MTRSERANLRLDLCLQKGMSTSVTLICVSARLRPFLHCLEYFWAVFVRIWPSSNPLTPSRSSTSLIKWVSLHCHFSIFACHRKQVFQTSIFHYFLSVVDMSVLLSPKKHIKYVLRNLLFSAVRMDFKKMFNSTTHVGRRNVSIATLGTIASIIVYKKMAGSSKVAAQSDASSKVASQSQLLQASNP